MPELEPESLLPAPKLRFKVTHPVKSAKRHWKMTVFAILVFSNK